MSDNSFRFHEVCTSRAGATGCKLIVQSMTVNGPMTRADRVDKAQFQKSWDAWKACAKLEEVP
jgi:hypothetical protein